jgi:hypothetical protein
MRIGDNPSKKDPNLSGYGLHRLIMPVYIPNTEGYFAQAVDVLRLCLESLRLTRKPATAVTIAANGCCKPALAVLQAEMEAGWLDQVIIHAQNRGKIDAIIGAARACFEPIVTFADSDVLFRHGWDSAIEKIFSTFPECGFVCPFCSPNAELLYTSATLLAGICRRALLFEQIANHSEVETFLRSIGMVESYGAAERLGQLVIRRDGVTAGIGGGHFACSFRREVISMMPAQPALRAICGGSETNWLDTPPDRLGYWRLMADNAFVQHMGNHLESWMPQEVADLRVAPSPSSPLPLSLMPIRRHWTAFLPYSLRVRLGTVLGRWIRERFRRKAAQTSG